MKKAIPIILGSCLLLIGFSCQKSTPANDKAIQLTLVGKWQLMEYLADPGDGSGTWQKVSAASPSYLEFKSDGSLESTPNSPYTADHYDVKSDSTMIMIRGTDQFSYRYLLQPGQLVLYPPCYEACGQRYVPAN